MTKLFYLSIFSSLLLVGCTTTSKKTQSKSNEPKAPLLRNAEVKTIWIPDRIEGNRFEEGHFIHLIDKQATWSE